MMKKFLKVTSAVTFCSALLMLSPTSEASTINYTFNGVGNSGELTGKLLSGGSFSYNDTTWSSSLGNLSIVLSALSFAFNGVTYDLTTKFATTTPTADFVDGAFMGVSYVSNTVGNRPTVSLQDGDQWTNPSLQYDPGTNQAFASGYGSVVYTNLNPAPSAVPAPAAIWLFGSGLAAFGVISRRKGQTSL